MALGSASGQTVSVSESGSAHYGRALTIVTTLFFMWGFLTALNDTLIPHLKQIFDLDYTKSQLINLAFFGSYFIFAQPAAKLIEAIGYKRTMVVGLGVMALGVFLFLPAASVPSYPFFLAAQIILAAGVTALQVAANPYVTVLGPTQHGVEPPESDPGLQLAGNHHRAATSAACSSWPEPPGLPLCRGSSRPPR